MLLPLPLPLLLLCAACTVSDAVMCRDVPIDTMSCPAEGVDPSTLYDPEGCAVIATDIVGEGSLRTDAAGSQLACCYPVRATQTCSD